MSTSIKKITLKSSDGVTFEVDEVVACESLLIKNIIEYNSNCVDSIIPLPKVTSKILAKVIDYCKKHVEAGNNTAAVYEELKAWDASFMMVDQETLFDLVLASHFLNIKGLEGLTTQTIADMMKGKTPEEIRKAFNIKKDFTPEEEEEACRDIGWAFE